MFRNSFIAALTLVSVGCNDIIVRDPSVPVSGQCLATDYQQPANISLEKLQLGENFPLITNITYHPDDDRVFFVTQQTGQISIVDLTGAAPQVELLVDLTDYYDVVFTPEGPGSCHECGLYDIEFHPDFHDNGYVYLSFTEGNGNGTALHSYIARFIYLDAERSLKLESGQPVREDIFTVEQPTRIHNNGKIAFDADGYLLAGLGDGGRANRSQDPSSPFGSILRLTDTGEPAPENLVEGVHSEVYASGLRNPWSWSIDTLTGDIWLGDVGQADVEEINIIEAGNNYGWPCYEGNQPLFGCSSESGFTAPVIDYTHQEGNSVTGGFVYRGSDLPELYGAYIYGDFVAGVVWALTLDSSGEYQRTQLARSGKYISSFSQDYSGEVYLLDYVNGEIYKLAQSEESELPPLPEKLSETGCIDMQAPHLANDGLIAFDVNEPLWSDGASKSRFVSLPETSSVELEGDGDFIFPIGTVLVKNFALNGKLVETRLLLNQPKTGWSGFSYAWNEGQTEATLLDGALEKEVDGQLWHYPSPSECKACHTPAANFALGPETLQLNKEITHPATGMTVNQLDYWEELDLFTAPLDHSLKSASLVRSTDDSKSLGERARSYLHSNCSHCHRPGGTTQASMDFRFRTSDALMNACEVDLTHEDVNLPGDKLISLGNAENSMLWQRQNVRGEGQMPPLATNVADVDGSLLLSTWVNQLGECHTDVGPIDAEFVLSFEELGLLNASDEGLLLSPEGVEGVSQWQFEPVEESFYRIKNVQDPAQFVHMEPGHLTIGTIQRGWYSAMWRVIKEGDGFYFQNRWQSRFYLGIDNGTPALVLNKDEALWQLLEVDD